ncbi:MAG: hypothetical protein KGZ41_03205 [Dethiobacter sp.]|jgi:DNA-directed RNA polymerase subunit RPC12/RpoP|nr:hypothetical protein [Dethiobacter sp.]MBS3982785.1 hypothetical protein [Dethiobacter sp.]MCL4463472.1 hypothetical protein [Bacillota bacterium]MCL5993708.1 hypothetical protein [Bacillota bacterium]
MFYYVDCPECKKDLSHFAKQENLNKEPIYCPYCENALSLKYGEIYEQEMGGDCIIFWFEKWED